MERPYELYYWPTIQGRGELVRLALEDAAAPYIDVAREPEEKGGGVKALMKVLHKGDDVLAPFAPPFLKSGDLIISHAANILLYLAPRHHLVADDPESQIRAHALQLTITDFLAEVHGTHHPVAAGLYYKDQKVEAKRYAKGFIEERIPKFTSYFEKVIVRGGGDHPFGVFSYIDLSLFQMVDGLHYAFPKAMKHIAPQIPHLTALHARVARRPRIAEYLASKRRVPFNEDGIFRHYPELDAPSK